MIAKTPKSILLVQGDWNVEVGPDAYQHWAGSVKFGTEETNNNGWTLLQFTKSH